MKFAILLVFALLWNVSAEAQQKLRLGILVEETDQDAARCGITKSNIESIAALTLRNNGVVVATDLTNPYLYLLVTVLPTAARGCAFHFSASVRGHSTLDFAQQPLGGVKGRKGSQ